MNTCVFAVRTQDPDAARERLASLARLYAPLGPAEPRQWWFAEARTLVGVIPFGACEPLVHREADAVLVGWGGPVPACLTSPDGVLAAGDGVLRALDRTVGLFAARGERARVVGAASGPVTVYAAASGETVAWSTHAAAASLLGRGVIEIDWDAVPEYLAADSVGGTDTHLRSVRTFPSAWLAEVEQGATHERSYWPPRLRWELHPEADAHMRASEALLDGLDRRLSGIDHVHCALTAGLDSRVVAVALRELGKETTAFTYGLPEWPDVTEAQRVAGVLGLPHEACGFDWHGDDDARDLIVRAALWSDGQSPAHGFALPRSPSSMAVSVTGNGGEAGRARYYDWLVRNYRAPSSRELVNVLGHLHGRVAGAPSDIHETLDDRLRRRVAAVQSETGIDGWRTLDALHVEWRGRRFVRTRLPQSDALVVGGFSHPELNRALVSLPLATRLGSGFHRAFIVEREPALAVPSPPRTARRFAPRRLLRLRHRIRSRRPPDPQPWLLADRWADYPSTREWLEDAVLADPAARSELGERWMDELRTGFANDESHATELTLRLASLVALQSA
jgi:hypothetical protein